MSDMALLAYHYSYSHGGSAVDWITHLMVSSIVHTMIYSVVFRAMHHLTISEAVVVAGVVIGCIVMWGRSRE